MLASVDGRIDSTHWSLPSSARQHYEDVHGSYEPDAWLCGRVTMEPFAKALRTDAEVAEEHAGDTPREDWTAAGSHESYAFAVDSRGRLAWASNDIGGDHVVAILTERVSDAYLGTLRDRGVSYLFAGGRELDLSLALEKIASRFGVQTLMLEGGGRINGAMLRAGLVDEVSVLIAPLVDARVGTPALFDVDGEQEPSHRLVLHAVERREDDVVWMRYRVDAIPQKGEAEA